MKNNFYFFITIISILLIFACEEKTSKDSSVSDAGYSQEAGEETQGGESELEDMSGIPIQLMDFDTMDIEVNLDIGVTDVDMD